MCAISSSSSIPATLAQAQAKLASDEAAKASAQVITTDQSEVTQFEKSQTPSTQTTGVNIVV
jgi:hypothetical protein